MFQLNSTTLSGHALHSLNQEALRRSHVFHGLQQRCGNTIHSHLQILTPCLEVCVLCSPKSIGHCGHFPIRCWLCHHRRIKQLCNTRLFPVPQLRDLSKRPFPHIEYSNTYLVQSEICNHISFSLRFSAAVVGLVKLLPTLTAAPQQGPRHRHSFTMRVDLQYALLSSLACLVPQHHTYLHTCLHTLLLVYSLG